MMTIAVGSCFQAALPALIKYAISCAQCQGNGMSLSNVLPALPDNKYSAKHLNSQLEPIMLPVPLQAPPLSCHAAHAPQLPAPAAAASPATAQLGTRPLPNLRAGLL